MTCDSCHAFGDQRTHSRQARSYYRTAGFDCTPNVDAEAVVGRICEAPARREDLMDADNRVCADTACISSADCETESVSR